MNLLTPFHEHALTSPESLALSVSGLELSYQQLSEKISRIAGWIKANAGSSNPRVGIFSSRSITAYTGVLAASYAGAAYVPINIKAPLNYLNETLRTARLDILIVDRTGTEILERLLPDGLPDLILSPCDLPLANSHIKISGPNLLYSLAPLSQPAACNLHDEAYLMFTSGTTGKPKGIVITIENILHLLTTLQRRYQFIPKDRFSQAFELTFDLSVFDIFMALRAGSSLHVIPETHMSTPAHFIQQHQLTVWFSVPSLIGMLKHVKLLRSDIFPSLRLSLFCGEALPEESARDWQEAAPNSRVENLYGPTEATVACLQQDCSCPNAVTPDRGTIAIGRPFDGLTTGIVDHEGHFLPPGEHGELAVCGPQVATGYLDNEELTRQRFPYLIHPELGSSRWYLTGDQAYMDDDGTYHFLGRIDNQVQLRGQRVELDAVEYHLRTVSGCSNAVIIFLDPQEIWAHEIIGVISSSSLNSREIRTQLSKLMPAYMIPKRIIIWEELPRNANGKIDRVAIKSKLSVCQGSSL